MDRPLLSICIPTYNRARYLEKLFESLLFQVNENTEVVVIDNNSSDNTRELVGRYPVRYVFNEKNIGSIANYYRCVEEAGGEYFWVIGDDDLISPGAIQAICRAIKNKPGAILVNFSQGENSNPNIKIIERSLPIKKNYSYESSTSIFANNFSLIFGLASLSSMVLRKDLCASTHKRLDTCFPQAYLFLDSAKGQRIELIAQPCFIWRSNLERRLEGSIHNDEANSLWEAIEYAKTMGYTLPNNYKDKRNRIDIKGILYNYFRDNNLLSFVRIFYRLPRLLKYYLEKFFSSDK